MTLFTMCFPPEDLNDKLRIACCRGAQNRMVLGAHLLQKTYWRPRYRQTSRKEVPKTGGFASPPFGGFALKQHPYYAMDARDL